MSVLHADRKKTKIVYIAGYGRSGSTLLDTTLGNHPHIFGAGELTWLFKYAALGKACTCGTPLAGCPLWQQVLDQVGTACGIHDLPKLALASFNAETLVRRQRKKSRPQHRAIWQAAFRAIHTTTQSQWIVDSSKSTRHTYHRLSLLHGLPDTELYVIHLVRDPRAVMWSTRRGSNRRLEDGLNAHIPGGTTRALLSWLTANRNVRRYCERTGSLRYLCVRYEDLAGNTGETLEKIGEFLACDLSTVNRQLDHALPLASGHGVSGNRLRRSGSIQWRIDDEWQSHHPWSDRILARWARPWLRTYGYDAPVYVQPPTDLKI